MPRPRQNASAPSLSPGQASYVVERLIAERRVSPGEVNRIIGDMHREIGDLERRLASLRSSIGTGGGSTGTGGARRGRPPGRPPGGGIRRRPGRPPGSPNKPKPAAAMAAPAAAPAGPRRRRRRTAITPDQLASRQLQGRYLGLIRQIPASRRGQYQKTAKERGREAAIRDMQDALKK